jgi:hypothetical protein
MAVGSIVLAALSLLFIPLGVVLSPLPWVGGVFAFGAPALSLASVIVGGVAMSRGKRAGESTSTAFAGVVTGAVAFVPALVTALTCGVCNALFTAGKFEAHRDFHLTMQQGAPLLPADAGVSPDQPSAPPPPPGAPPPAFPPPPIKP